MLQYMTVFDGHSKKGTRGIRSSTTVASKHLKRKQTLEAGPWSLRAQSGGADWTCLFSSTKGVMCVRACVSSSVSVSLSAGTCVVYLRATLTWEIYARARYWPRLDFVDVILIFLLHRRHHNRTASARFSRLLEKARARLQNAHLSATIHRM